MILIVLTFCSFFLYAALLLYYYIGWKDLKTFEKGQEENTEAVFISVIVPARNEENNLQALLDSFLNQSYPNSHFEIIIVDDHSSDKSSAIIANFPLSNLRLINLADHVKAGINSYKKKAIDVAILHSKGELIVTTDADCIVKPDWLKTISAFYEKQNKPSMIIMPVVVKCNHSMIGIFQALDFMTLQGVTAGAVQQGLHAMCNGANLGYTRKAFTEVKGFEGIDNLASGDDMLLMNKIQRHRPGSILYLKSEDVIVTTAAMSTVRDFLNQRIRWASKTTQYKHKPILFSAAIVYIFNVLILILFITGLVNNQVHTLFDFSLTTFSAFVYIFSAKIIVEIFFLFPMARFFKQQELLLYFPFIQPLHIVYTILAGGLGTFGKYEWKGRKVK